MKEAEEREKNHKAKSDVCQISMPDLESMMLRCSKESATTTAEVAVEKAFAIMRAEAQEIAEQVCAKHVQHVDKTLSEAKIILQEVKAYQQSISAAPSLLSTGARSGTTTGVRGWWRLQNSMYTLGY